MTVRNRIPQTDRSPPWCHRTGLVNDVSERTRRICQGRHVPVKDARRIELGQSYRTMT